MRFLAVLAFAALVSLSAWPVQAWLSASRTYVSFPTVKVGRAWEDSVSITNFGPEAASGLMVSDTCYLDFSAVHTCFFELQAGQSCNLTVRYQPSRAGRHTCSMTVTSLGQGMVTVSFEGQAE
ncbi:MAG: choice-of-anchor D domain-containing protein [Bdellovibrionaceae bacterium]|nr:choice-of-anchor D domain-containing protein [Pseudobdellovibrionaceae bacterium]